MHHKRGIDCRADAGLGVAGEGGVEAVDDGHVVGDFGCEAVYASDGGQGHEGCDEGVLDHVLPRVVGFEATKHCERDLALAWAEECAPGLQMDLFGSLALPGRQVTLCSRR